MDINSSPHGPTRRKGLIGGVVLLLLIIGIVSAVAVVKMRSHTGAVKLTSEASGGNAALFYPGAQTIVDMTNTDGSRTIQLETADQLDRVESWYQTHLKLTKTVRLTSASVVMKNEKVTITLANEDSKTVVLIKQAPLIN